MPRTNSAGSQLREPGNEPAPAHRIRVGQSTAGAWHILKRDGGALCGSRAALPTQTIAQLRMDDCEWLCSRCLRSYVRPGKQLID